MGHLLSDAGLLEDPHPDVVDHHLGDTEEDLLPAEGLLPGAPHEGAVPPLVLLLVPVPPKDVLNQDRRAPRGADLLVHLHKNPRALLDLQVNKRVVGETVSFYH